MNVLINNEIATALNARRLPARLNSGQVAALLGFSYHDIPVLTARKLLRPLGKPTPNSTKFYAAVEIERCAQDVEWLSKATRALTEHWALRNSRKSNQLTTCQPTLSAA